MSYFTLNLQNLANWPLFKHAKQRRLPKTNLDLDAMSICLKEEQFSSWCTPVPQHVQSFGENTEASVIKVLLVFVCTRCESGKAVDRLLFEFDTAA